MPHLDANALADDPEGMEFLREVLDVSPSAPRPWGAFEVKPLAVTPQRNLEAEINRPRRLALVPEAA